MGTLIQFPTPRRRSDLVDDIELDDAVFWTPLVFVWFAGVARVVLALAHGDAFGAEPTLASAYLLALPLAGGRHWYEKQRRSAQLRERQAS